MMNIESKSSRLGPASAFFAAMAGVPLFGSDFWTMIGTEVLIMGLFAMSFNLIYGYMGQISFGHAAFFGAGAYATAMIQQRFGLSYSWFFVALAASVPAAAAVAALIGFFVIRRTGIYFAILTMAFGELMFFLVFSSYSVTGGDNGIQGLLPPAALRVPANYHYFVLAVVGSACAMIWWITQSPFGFMLRAIRDNARRVKFVGVDVERCMLLNFVIAGAFAGLAGGLWAPFTRSVAPTLLNWQESGIPIFMALIGGAYSFAGPLVGSLVYTLLHAWVTGFTQYWSLVIGTTMFLIVFYCPTGILGLLLLALNRIPAFKRRGASALAVERKGQ
jgi:branched-chain amino acid transport system permease protein